MIAALPMYDWPEARAEIDALWADLRGLLARQGVDAPATLVRRNADMPAVPGGIRDQSGQVLAADPASLPPDELDLPALWHHPHLLLGQTCWGPMGQGLRNHVLVVGQPDYSAYEGGAGPLYSSAILMRKQDGQPSSAPEGSDAQIPVALLRNRRFAFNDPGSMSGLLALTQDLQADGEGVSALFAAKLETGGHRASARAVAEEQADLCACDCRSWAMLQRFDPDVAARLHVVGWTGKRPGLPFIMAPALKQHEQAVRNALRAALQTSGT